MTCFPLIFREGRGSEQVRYGPQIDNELLDVSVDRFLTSLRIQQRGKLDQLGIEIDSFD